MALTGSIEYLGKTFEKCYVKITHLSAHEIDFNHPKKYRINIKIKCYTNSLKEEEFPAAKNTYFGSNMMMSYEAGEDSISLPGCYALLKTEDLNRRDMFTSFIDVLE